MKVGEVLSSARDTFTVKRVYGEPYEKDGLTVIPAAVVSGGAGGGTGHDEKGQEGEGGGFGMIGRPAGGLRRQRRQGQVAPRGGPEPDLRDARDRRDRVPAHSAPHGPRPRRREQPRCGWLTSCGSNDTPVWDLEHPKLARLSAAS